MVLSFYGCVATVEEWTTVYGSMLLSFYGWKDTPMTDTIHLSHIDLLRLIPHRMKRVARTKGGEWHGPCPFCGGTDRFIVWPDHPSGRGRFTCRQCEVSGDAITYIRERDGIGFREACALLGVDTGTYTPVERQPYVPESCEPPCQTWQNRMHECIEASFARLYGKNDKPLAYLHKRGLNDTTISHFVLGYNDRDQWIPAVELGIDRESPIYLPRGIVIPVYISNLLWKVAIRRPTQPGDTYKYHTVASRNDDDGIPSNPLYNADSIQYGKPAILVEGYFDAMAIHQAARDHVSPVASGTSGGRMMRWIHQLARAKPLLLSYDRDEPGTKAMAYWRHAFPNCTTWRTPYADPAQLLKDGGDVRGWVQAGLRYALREPAQPSPVQTPPEPAPAQSADDQMPAQPVPVAPACQSAQPASGQTPDTKPLKTVAPWLANQKRVDDTLRRRRQQQEDEDVADIAARDAEID